MVWLPVSYWRDRRLGTLPPALAADVALRIFCTPEISQWRHLDHPQLAQRARYHLRNALRSTVATPVGHVALYAFEPDGPARSSVLFVHGWTSEASFMTALAEPVRRAGYRIVLMDMPGHGASEGRRTNLVDCARAVLAVGESIGPLAAIVAHSFGGMVALLAMEGGAPLTAALPVPKIALVASANRLPQITELFAAHWHLAQPGLRLLEMRLARIGHRSVAGFSSARLLKRCGARALVLHAEDDEAVPISAAREIARDVPGTRLETFRGLGHRNILFASQVARAIVAFLKEDLSSCAASLGG